MIDPLYSFEQNQIIIAFPRNSGLRPFASLLLRIAVTMVLGIDKIRDNLK